jgi:hypothetical protein
VYDNPEPLVTLSSIAGAVGRIRVQTEVLLARFGDGLLCASPIAERSWQRARDLLAPVLRGRERLLGADQISREGGMCQPCFSWWEWV